MKCFLRTLLFFILCLSTVFADPLQHGKYFHEDMKLDLTKYYVSEKLDGFRGYWNGKELRSKTGYPYNPPKWFIENLGDQPLDGELWIDRDEFTQLIPILNGTENPENWHKVNYMIFDMPNIQKPFGERVEYMKYYIPSLNLSYVKMIPQEKIQSIDELKHKLNQVVAMKGEGLMLHHEDALYGSGRVNHLLKVKQYDEDKGRVIGYKPGKGKYKGMVGALIIELKDGSIVNVGSGLTDEMRKNPPAINEVVAFIYNGLTNHGKPRFPRFKRLRNPSME
ncbi:DNA ligase [Wohlfahrtiimonas larvae]